MLIHPKAKRPNGVYPPPFALSFCYASKTLTNGMDEHCFQRKRKVSTFVDTLKAHYPHLGTLLGCAVHICGQREEKPPDGCVGWENITF